MLHTFLARDLLPHHIRQRRPPPKLIDRFMLHKQPRLFAPDFVQRQVVGLHTIMKQLLLKAPYATASSTQRQDALRLQRGAIWPLLLAIGLCLSVLIALFGQPYRRDYPRDAWVNWASGVYELETVAPYTYVHTNGAATLRFPDSGVGQFAVTLGLAGTGGFIPTSTRLVVNDQPLTLGTLTAGRTYHIFAPPSASGQLQVQVNSTAQQVADDPRILGARINYVSVQALQAALPPPALWLSIVGAAGLLWSAIRRLDLPVRRQVVALCGCSLLLAGSAAATRGRLALAPVALTLGVCGLPALALCRYERVLARLSRRGVVALIVAWRIGLWIVGGIGLWYSRDIYRYGRGNAFNFGTTIGDHTRLAWRIFADAWMQWDSAHYATIALSGYTFTGVRWPNVAFFPLYPLLIRVVLPFMRNNIDLAALLVAHLALCGALLLLHDMLLHDFGRIIATRTIILLLVFPTAFFFAAGYTESLALALAVAAVWAIRRQRWWLAGLAGAALAMTRVPGVLLAPVIGLTYMQQQRWRWRSIRPPILTMLLPPLGLALFMLYQWWRFDTPFAFLIAQQSWNNGAGAPWSIPIRLWLGLQSAAWEMALLQFTIWAGILGLSLLALRKLPLVYGLTGLLLLPAYLAQQEDSVSRHVLIAFPAFVVLAQVARRLWLRWAITTIMLAALITLTLMFVNGFFIA